MQLLCPRGHGPLFPPDLDGPYCFTCSWRPTTTIEALGLPEFEPSRNRRGDAYMYQRRNGPRRAGAKL